LESVEIIVSVGIIWLEWVDSVLGLAVITQAVATEVTTEPDVLRTGSQASRSWMELFAVRIVTDCELAPVPEALFAFG
jgi:hypothetical protein